MKILKRCTAVALAIAFCLFGFVGCSSEYALKKVGKKLTTYSIDAVYCDQEKKITGIEKVDYINNTGTILNSVCFNLYGKAFSDEAEVKPYSKTRIDECFPNGINYGDMNVTSAMVGDSSAVFKVVGSDDNAIEVGLAEPLYSGERVEIVLEFELRLANCTHRLGYNDGKVNLGNWYPVVAVYENGGFKIDPYYSNGDPFYSDCANYNVSLSYDNKYNLSSTGNLVETIEESGVVRTSYSAYAVRDFAMVLLSDFESRCSEVDGVVVTVTSHRGDENLGSFLTTAERSLELFNNLYGNYPYKNLNVVFTDFCQGGMEYPNLVFISTSVTQIDEIKKVIVHEIAHQWWYGVVGNNEVDCAWFDEGLAEYSTLLYYENYADEGVDAKKMLENSRSSYELYIDVIKTLNIDINYSMALPLNAYTTEYEYVYMIYVKGLLFFDTLRTTLGDELFFKSLSEIYEEYKFDNINKEEFIAQIEKTSKMDLSELIEGWLLGSIDITK